MVLLFHLFASIQTDFALGEKNLFSVGAYGVDIFFILSGFIICHATSSDKSPSRFYIKRIIRVVPLYYVTTLGLFAIAMVLPGLLNSTSAEAVPLLKSLLFIPYEKANGLVQPLLFLGWSLNYEMFFYLIFGVGLSIMPTRSLQITAAIIGTIYLAGLIIETDNVLIEFYTRGILLEFLFGIAAYWYYTKYATATPALWLLLPIGILIFALENLAPLSLPSRNQLIDSLPREFIRGIPALMIVVGTLYTRPKQGRIGQFLERLGDASYSLYLTHPYIIQIMVKVMIPILGLNVLTLIGASVLSIGLSIVVALLLFKLIEDPANRSLRKWLPPKK